jgi:hypothetical protein
VPGNGKPEWFADQVFRHLHVSPEWLMGKEQESYGMHDFFRGETSGPEMIERYTYVKIINFDATDMINFEFSAYQKYFISILANRKPPAENSKQ